MSKVTFAFKATSETEYQDDPACLVWTLTDEMRNSILDAINEVKANKFDEVRLSTTVDAVEDDTDDDGNAVLELLLGEDEARQIDNEGIMVVAEDTFEKVQNYMPVRGDQVVVDWRGYIRLTCYDKYTYAQFDTQSLPAGEILGAVAVGEVEA